MFVVAGPDLTAQQLHDLLRLRVDVFVVEQECAYPELDGRDLEPSTRHVWLEDETGISCALRVLADPEGRRIGRVVTRPDARGRGEAARLMEATIQLVGSDTTMPTNTIVLDAQTYLQRFYEGLGFEPTGPEFVEDGIPHIPMRRNATVRTKEPRP